MLGLYCGTRLFSSPLRTANVQRCISLVEVSRGSSPVVVCGFLLWSRIEGPSVRPQELGRMGLVAPGHVGSSQTWARTYVLCLGRQILNHWTRRKSQDELFGLLSSLRYPQCLEQGQVMETICQGGGGRGAPGASLPPSPSLRRSPTSLPTLARVSATCLLSSMEETRVPGWGTTAPL